MQLLIPVKEFAQAKSRLSYLLSEERRSRLASAMLMDLIAEALHVPEIERITLVSSEPSLQSLSIPGVAVVMQREVTLGLNAALTEALAALYREGSRRAMIIHGDLPLARSGDLQSLIRAFDSEVTRPDVMLVPDANTVGTNGLLCRLPLGFPLCFGKDSLARHHQAAAMAHLECMVKPVTSLALDVDDAPSFEAMAAIVLGGWAAPGQTADLIRSWRLPVTTTTRQC